MKKLLSILIFTSLIMGCKEAKEEFIVEPYWENHYIIDNKLAKDIVIASYFNESSHREMQIDTVAAFTSSEILEVGGMGHNEKSKLNTVFDSLIVRDLISEAIIYQTDFSIIERWGIKEVEPKNTIIYTLTIK